MFFKKFFFIKSCDFLSVKYSFLQKKPILLNDRFIFTSYNGVKGFIYNFGKDLLKKKKIQKSISSSKKIMYKIL
ncbi:hypothetical protein [Blattabacterium cuenoti]|uniref:hypothetical protein n=1 Tax=Blattabacterium cuenoti TaxID=1653831 RepID=UPI00163BA501|nr:hypothetical protein [Blattabacterium cuenoti]